MSCSPLAKVLFMPGCRPWDPVLDSPTIIQYNEPVGPFQPPQLDAGEFGPVQYVQTTISNVIKNANRLVSSTLGQIAPQSETPSLWARITSPFSGAGDFLQSTMIKVIVLVLVTGFFLIYFQAKVANLAK